MAPIPPPLPQRSVLPAGRVPTRLRLQSSFPQSPAALPPKPPGQFQPDSRARSFRSMRLHPGAAATHLRTAIFAAMPSGQPRARLSQERTWRHFITASASPQFSSRPSVQSLALVSLPPLSISSPLTGAFAPPRMWVRGYPAMATIDEELHQPQRRTRQLQYQTTL